jgi:hydrogenase maturation protein HypF
VVQGVGFRPFVKRLADRLSISGIVANTAGGVVIDVETNGASEVEEFVAALQSEAPVIARIESLAVEALPIAAGFSSFEIQSSHSVSGEFTLISPDVATCSDCLRDISDPLNRRYRYAFTNCTNCGPRYSITTGIPYDRVNTTMAPFQMCSACIEEYRDPNNRRFHAEPNACPFCGPALTIEPPAPNALAATIQALEDGRIVALKGLGGFQLACNAENAAAIDALRSRKKRSRKPFAVMMPDLQTAEKFCRLSERERALLAGAAGPIVLAQLREPRMLPDCIAPGLRELGVMLPYTPVHRLLFSGKFDCLVMTSGNISEEPIVISNGEAAKKLSPVADALLTHDRDIFMRVDDSVVREYEDRPRVLRRARGYAPTAIDLGFDAGEVLACGAELKSTFCITRANYAILSQHLGDLENFETLQFFEETLQNLKHVYRAEPRLIAHDLHPDYMSTQWAARQPLERMPVQHHHAHIASCMAENGLRERVIGVAFDGTGYGTDGQIWGGEFLVADYGGFHRAAHLRYVPLIGGEPAIREPYRMAASHLRDAFGESYRSLDLSLWLAAEARNWNLFDRIFDRSKLMTSSVGRLFDAASAIGGICPVNSYEGEAAILLEAAGTEWDASAEPVEVPVQTSSFPWVIDTRPLIREIARKSTSGHTTSSIADTFHSSIAHMIRTICIRLCEVTGITKVCMSGGSFQNCTLLSRTLPLLRQSGFEIFLHSKVPPNDGGISLGQAVIAATYLDKGRN